MSQKTDTMLDLETLGNGSNAAIIAIGAVKFDPKQRKILDKFYCRVDPQSCIDAGLTITGSTILWWMQQSEAARAEFKGTLPPLRTALEGFSAWIKKPVLSGDPGEKTRVWGNGATFDNVIASSAYHALRMERPWDYRSDRCYRTVKALFPQVQLPSGLNLTGHRADHDAEFQAMHLMDIWPHLYPQS